MDMIAWGAHHYEKTHNLLESGGLILKESKADGSVAVQVKIAQPFGIGGEYYVKMVFTKSEVSDIFHESIAGQVKSKIMLAT